MNKKKAYNRIKYLEKTYSETNVARGEVLSPNTIRKINRNYYDNQRKRRVDGILNTVKNRDTIKEEVHSIIDELPNLRVLCKGCNEEIIISSIILYVQKSRNYQYRVDRTSLWKKYNITWQKYALIISNLLRETRKKRKI